MSFLLGESIECYNEVASSESWIINLFRIIQSNLVCQSSIDRSRMAQNCQSLNAWKIIELLAMFTLMSRMKNFDRL